jgi:transposase
MKFNANSLPNVPEQLKQMLLELQQRMDEELAVKDNELVEKDLAYQAL